MTPELLKQLIALPFLLFASGFSVALIFFGFAWHRRKKDGFNNHLPSEILIFVAFFLVVAFQIAFWIVLFGDPMDALCIWILAP